MGKLATKLRAIRDFPAVPQVYDFHVRMREESRYHDRASMIEFAMERGLSREDAELAAGADLAQLTACQVGDALSARPGRYW